jgi:hypothetical protein
VSVMYSRWVPARWRRVLLLTGGALLASLVSGGVPAVAQTLDAVPAPKPAASVAPGAAVQTSAAATLQQCFAVGAQSERSATFAGEMTAIPGTARMEMRINLVEKLPEETQYRLVSSPGLGAWRFSATGVKVFTSINHVTNLSSPALYRGAVRFRWLNAKGHVMKVEELRTPRCEQPAVSATNAPTTTLGSS